MKHIKLFESFSDETPRALDNLKVGEPKSIEKFLEEIGETASGYAKNKGEALLDEKIYFQKNTTTNYSGSYHVPNPTYTVTYFVPESGKFNEYDLKAKISDLKAKEKVRKKDQDRREENHDYRFQKPSSQMNEYGITTLRKVLKDFDNRPKSFRGAMSSSTYNYNIVKVVS